MQYQVYGLTLSSDTPLPELTPAAYSEPPTKADVRVQLSGRRKKFPTPSHWFISWALPTGELWLSCARCPGGYLLRFPELADFSVDVEGREIVCFAGPETSPDTLRHLLLDQVLPLVLNLQGREALHATAVLTPRGVCAFTGPTGTGKSTLAASFLFAGYPVLSDDCLVLEENRELILATPAYPGLRLWEDALEVLCEDTSHSFPVAHYTSKRRLAPKDHLGDFPTGPHPVVRIYCLGRPAETEEGGGLADPFVEHLSCREGFMELVVHIFRLDITDRRMLIRQFGFLERVVSRVPVRRFHLLNDFSSLPTAREAILADLEDR